MANIGRDGSNFGNNMRDQTITNHHYCQGTWAVLTVVVVFVAIKLYSPVYPEHPVYPARMYYSDYSYYYRPQKAHQASPLEVQDVKDTKN